MVLIHFKGPDLSSHSKRRESAATICMNFGSRRSNSKLWMRNKKKTQKKEAIWWVFRRPPHEKTTLGLDIHAWLVVIMSSLFWHCNWFSKYSNLILMGTF
ncbi:hypothetical protein GDO81_016771 [Engystomops pustulosus]|uniref:Uncharacterized protein n=1 Tax=Engystomops pustulosus TaxID=76066 RepID=A0AAV7ACP5_ENGPU|nr:hypothetical protein GDO81_016771 [Engystomops pustulosus]